MRNGYFPEREVVTGIGNVSVRVAEGAILHGQAGDVPLLTGAPVRAPEPVTGGGAAVSEGDRYRPDERGPGSSGWQGGARSIGLRRESAETAMAGGVRAIFSTITQKQLNRAMNKLNHRPRKTLGARTPHKVFFNVNIALQS